MEIGQDNLEWAHKDKIDKYMMINSILSLTHLSYLVQRSWYGSPSMLFHAIQAKCIVHMETKAEVEHATLNKQ